jgi:hypothetical protein
MLEIESQLPPAPRTATHRPLPKATEFHRCELVQLEFAVPTDHDSPFVLEKMLPVVLLGEVITNRKFPFDACPLAIDVRESPAVTPVTFAFVHVNPSEL